MKTAQITTICLALCISVYAWMGAESKRSPLKPSVYTKNVNGSIKPAEIGSTKKSMDTKKTSSPVFKKVLDNGITVLVKPVSTIPKVSVQMFYNVGSIDEGEGEKGIAHLIEHMIFKGTKDLLSESDINDTAHRLSAEINAFTSYDYTGYLFNIPVENWPQVLPIIADTMENVAFKEEHLNSEMKAVVQELKMYRDNYDRSLLHELMYIIFADGHPYADPVIGYKHNLWNMHSADLVKFYKKHYVPNNSVLVVVGDVKPNEVFQAAQDYLGHIQSQPYEKKPHQAWLQDIASRSVTLYRDLQKPVVMLTAVLPGTKAKQEGVLETLAWALGKGRASRLYSLLVDELGLVTDVDSDVLQLFEQSVFIISFHPKKQEKIDLIIKTIHEELNLIGEKGFTIDEINRALNQARVSLYSQQEDLEHQAYMIGKLYLATQDENYLYTYLNELTPESASVQIKKIVKDYLRSSFMFEGKVLPLSEADKDAWKKIQSASDQEDARILGARQRTEPVEPARYALTVHPGQPKKFAFPKAESVDMDNGMKLLYFDNKNTPTIDIVIDFKARPYYDSSELPGLYEFVTHMMLEGTKKYSAQELARVLEERGISLSVYPGGIAMKLLSKDLEFALDILNQVVACAQFPADRMGKVRDEMSANIKAFWDNPRRIAMQIAREQVYKDHPYAKNMIGTQQSIKKITRNDLVNFYKKYITPQGASIAIVGDTQGYDIAAVVKKHLSSWQGPQVESIKFPTINFSPDKASIDYPMNRDQISLTWAGLSVSRLNPDYDKLVLFDQVFGGGALGSMSSRLFQLRERTGLFYGISGYTTSQAAEDPGMIVISTMVSADRMDEAEKAIISTISTVTDTIDEEDIDQARQAIASSMLNNFESNGAIARAFLFLNRYNLPASYFDNRAAQLAKIDMQDIIKTAAKYLNKNNLALVRVGRIEK
ncbi:insulinase family protein [Vermiphilus pyriformis]|uniref:Peptidase M16 n=1 Tax=candidate division TM6 bacterium JCVI TM6SC1 TaxID=1306947 RepID=A0A0D2JE97_9BACT|nr:hypothetical protein J120_00175 [candidate division TM6 bacterium JCVI TM6SC1]UNE34959.1 MAG: insulinase family protein [Vermiphilus pyriformis]